MVSQVSDRDFPTLEAANKRPGEQRAQPKSKRRRRKGGSPGAGAECAQGQSQVNVVAQRGIHGAAALIRESARVDDNSSGNLGLGFGTFEEPAATRRANPSIAAQNTRLLVEVSEKSAEHHQLRLEAEKVTASVMALLERRLEPHSGVGVDTAEVVQMREELAKLQQFRTEVLDRKEGVETESTSKKSIAFINPNSVKTAGDLAEFVADIEKIVASLSTDQRPPLSDLSDTLGSLKGRRDALVESKDDLETPIHRKLGTLNQQIQAMEAKPVHESSFEGITRFTGLKQEQITAELHRRDEILKSRKERQDELVVSWSQMVVRADTSNWAIDQLHHECGLLNDLATLSTEFDQLLVDVQEKKVDMKAIKSDDKFDSSAQQATLKELEAIVQRYTDLNVRATDLKERVETVLVEMEEKIQANNPEGKVSSLVTSHTYYDSSKKEAVQREATEKFQKLLEDQKLFKKDLEARWDELAEKVKYHAPIKIERFGDAASHNGVLPNETVFNTTWSLRTLRYVPTAFEKEASAGAADKAES